MKHHLFLFIAIISTVLYSCNNSEEEYYASESHSFGNGVDMDYGTSTDTSDTWMNHGYCILNGTKPVKAPWTEGAVSAAPSEALTDVDSADGWKILYSTVAIDGYNKDYNFTSQTEGANYILFYNSYTGMLKGFCYLEEVSPNNHGMWYLSVDNATKLFNFAGEYAIPMDGQCPRYVYGSNVTDEGLSAGFTKGWNCFELELAYDPESENEKLNISAITLNESQSFYTDSMNISTTGNIRMTIAPGSNGVLKAIASAGGKAIGDYVDNWIGGNKRNSPKKSIAIGGVVAAGVSSLLSTGLNKIFKSASGNNYKDASVSLSSNAVGNIKGASIQPSSGIVVPIKSIPLNSLHQALGVWNLSSAPDYLMHKHTPLLYGYYHDNEAYTMFYYQLESESNYHVIVNPLLTNHYCGLARITHESYYGQFSAVMFNNSPTGLFNYPYRYKIEYSGYYPRWTMDIYQNGNAKATPAAEWNDDVNPYVKDVEYHFTNTVRVNGRDYVSCKTFKPNSKLIFNVSRPYQWSFKELVNGGWLKYE